MMKRILTLLAGLAASMTLALAQPESLSVYTSSSEVVHLNMFSHTGYGFHFVSKGEFTANTFGNGEFFLNILDLNIRPVEAFEIKLGADIAFNHFHSKDYAFYQTGGDAHLMKAVKFADMPSLAGSYSETMGYFGNFFFSFPLLLKAHIDGFSFGAGAEANLNISGNNGYRYRQDYKRTDIKEEKLGMNLFSYGIIATLSYNGAGLYFKYYPASSRILADGSAAFSYWTLGVCFGL